MGITEQYIAVIIILIIVALSIVRYFFKRHNAKNACANCSERECCLRDKKREDKKCCK